MGRTNGFGKKCCNGIIVKSILIIPSRYPTIYQPHNYIFVEDQAKVLAQKYNVQVMGCVTISVKDIFRKGVFALGIQQYEKDNISVILLLIPSLPKLKRINNFFRYLGNKLLVKHYVKKVDIVHLHTYLAGDIAIKLKKEKKIPYVITEHSSLLLYDHIDNFDFNLVKKVFSFSDKNIAVSTNFATVLSKKFDTQFDVVPNIVDTNLFKPNLIKDEKNGEVSFLTVGNLVDVKNHKLMIESFTKAFLDNPKVKLNIIGSGPNENAIRELIDSLKMQNQIFLLGYKTREQIAIYLNNSDLFLMTSKHETFCIAVIEAMSSAIPVICTNFGGVVEDIKHLENCYITDHSNDSLSLIISDVVSQKSFYSESNRVFTLENFSEQSFLERIDNVYCL